MARTTYLCPTCNYAIPEAAELIDERDEWKRLAESWMADYDKLKEKYEPSYVVESSSQILTGEVSRDG